MFLQFYVPYDTIVFCIHIKYYVFSVSCHILQWFTVLTVLISNTKFYVSCFTMVALLVVVTHLILMSHWVCKSAIKNG